MLLALGAAWLVVCVASIALGPTSVPLSHLLRWLLDPAGDGLAASLPTHEGVVIWELRLPRTLLATVVGAALGACGALSQGLFRNPLADPGLIGVSAGAILGTAIGLVLLGPAFALAPPWLRVAALPLTAFASGGLATSLVMALGRQGGRSFVVSLLLAGVAMNALMGALVGLLSYVASDAELRNLTFWTLGGLSQASWTRLAFTTPLVVLAVSIGIGRAGALDLYALGEADATLLGVDVPRLRRLIVVALSLGVGAAVTAAGLVGFVGLLVPHFVRLLAGPSHRVVIPASAVAGGVLTVAADTLARTLAAPLEIPVGVLTSLVGAPLFLHLLVRSRGSS
jgi:iron complex transport system permease protein